MIVVIGSPSGRRVDGRIVADGPVAAIAAAASAGGASVQLVGRLGDDVAADAVLQDLVRHGVGHVAILRDAAHATPVEPFGDAASEVRPTLEAADVELALRYLTEFAVLVLLETDPAIVRIAAEAADWARAALLIVRMTPEAAARTALPGSTVMEPEVGEMPGAFAIRVATAAMALDAR